MNAYTTAYRNLNTGKWTVGPRVQGRDTTARIAAQKASQWVSTTTGMLMEEYIVSASNVSDAGDHFTTPTTRILDY